MLESRDQQADGPLAPAVPFSSTNDLFTTLRCAICMLYDPPSPFDDLSLSLVLFLLICAITRLTPSLFHFSLDFRCNDARLSLATADKISSPPLLARQSSLASQSRCSLSLLGLWFSFSTFHHSNRPPNKTNRHPIPLKLLHHSPQLQLLHLPSRNPRNSNSLNSLQPFPNFSHSLF